MAMSSRSMLEKGRTTRPRETACASVAGDVAAHVMSSRRAASPGTCPGPGGPATSPTTMPFSTSAAAAVAATRFSALKSVPVTTDTRSAARDILPRQLLVGPDVAREAEHPFTEDVAHDLGRAALNGVGTHAHEHLADVGRALADGV